MYRVLVADHLSDEGIAILKAEPQLDVAVQAGLTGPVLAQAIRGFDGLVVRSSSKVTKEVIDAADRLRVIGRAGVGLDNVDVEAASKKGIVVINTPGGNTISAAEHSFCLLLALVKEMMLAVHFVNGCVSIN